MTELDLLMIRLFARSDSAGLPLSGTFELTSRCTLDCKMCYIHKKENDCLAIRGEKDADWWTELARRATDSGMLLLLLTGGEPMIRKDFEKIYLACREMGLLVSVNTNATLIDGEKVRMFAENPPNRLNISLYGASEKTYESLCGSGEAYHRVVEAIKKLREAGVKMKLNYTMTLQNASDAPLIDAFAKELDVPVQAVSYMFPPVRAGGKEAERPDFVKAAKNRFEWERLIHGDGFEEHIMDTLSGKAKPKCDGCEERINCRAGLSSFWITSDGRMTPCGMMNEPCCDADDFSAAWGTLRSEREKIILPSECGGCEYRNVCDVCAAVTLAETGSFNGKPDYVCKKAKAYSLLCNDYLSKNSSLPLG